MFHVKHLLETGLESYKTLVADYHATLDLMSSKGLARLGEMVEDSLTYARHVETLPGGTVLDVGSGAGLPGIPMALALPHHTFHLVERRSRRAAFLKLASSQLGLTNVKVYLSDVAKIKDVEASFVTAQAVASLRQLYCMTRHLHESGVIIISRKGDTWRQELEELTLATRTSNDSEVTTIPLSRHGTLVSVQMPGGRVCRPLE